MVQAKMTHFSEAIFVTPLCDKQVCRISLRKQPFLPYQLDSMTAL